MVFNKIDFAVKAPKFKISFDYTDDRGLSFVREFVLRLLKITPCKPEQIAAFFDFDQEEISVVLEDLLNSKYIKRLPSGEYELDSQGRLLFGNLFGEPRLNKLQEKSVDLYIELKGQNFVRSNQAERFNGLAIELEVNKEYLANSEALARKRFQNKFLELQEDGFFDLNGGQYNQKRSVAELYKINDITALGIKYFFFTQEFCVDSETGLQLDRNEICVKNSEELALGVTEFVTRNKRSQNLESVLQSANQLGDVEILEVLRSGLSQKKIEILNQFSQNVYFIGQIYHQDFIENELKKSMHDLSLKDKDEVKNLVWFGVDDIYWSKQRSIESFLDVLINKQFSGAKNERRKLYDLKFYLPLEQSNDRQSLHEWRRFKNTNLDNNLYGFKAGLLNGNTEIMILEGEFAIICYHLVLDSCDVTIPVGMFSRDSVFIQKIFDVLQRYLNCLNHDDREKSPTFDFGKLRL